MKTISEKSTNAENTSKSCNDQCVYLFNILLME